MGLLDRVAVCVSTRLDGQILNCKAQKPLLLGLWKCLACSGCMTHWVVGIGTVTFVTVAGLCKTRFSEHDSLDGMPPGELGKCYNRIYWTAVGIPVRLARPVTSPMRP